MSEHQAVLVTGSSTGIGEACVRYLSARGLKVFAGVRRNEDGERLVEAAGPAVEPVLLDVTSADSIAPAARAIAESVGEDGLAGLVNNAGISVSGVLELLPIARLREQLEVNLIGPVAVTQALLPSVRRARGRIVNIGSISGRVAPPVIGAYAMSKFGLRAFSDSLRRELAAQGIHVSLIEPGAIATPIWDKARRRARRVFQEVDEGSKARYAPLVRGMRQAAGRSAAAAIAPEAVAREVHHALTAPRPRTHYLVGRDARRSAFAAWLFPARVVDRFIRKELERL